MEDFEIKYYRVYSMIDLDAVRFNMEQMRQRVGEEPMICAVIKTDAYGHGAVPIVKALGDQIDYCAVATVEEAFKLREHGVTKPILILGYVHPSRYEELIRAEVRLPIFKREDAELLSEAAVRVGLPAKFHFKVDTGMSRIGFPACEASVREMAEIAALPGIEAEGIFTHFARADETDKRYAVEQHDRFVQVVNGLAEAGVQIPVVHCDNSAGIIDLPEWHHSMVRAGISIYGLYPSDEVEKERVALKPLLSLKSHVVFVKEVPAGTAVSYGGTFRAERTTRVATIPVGYGDGYPRSLSNKGAALIRGHRVPIIGRVCMDQFMADITDYPDIEEGDVVTLIGRDGDEEITADDLANLTGTISYEIVCDLTARIPKLYRIHGEYAGTADELEEKYER